MPIVLPEPRYGSITVRGSQMKVWLNPPLSLLADLSKTDVAIIGALERLVVEHDVQLPSGEPAPISEWNDMELVADVVKAWREASKSLPPASSAPSK